MHISCALSDELKQSQAARCRRTEARNVNAIQQLRAQCNRRQDSGREAINQDWACNLVVDPVHGGD
eukprot:2801080-Pleurochrysis_carterae.AAC.1